MAKITCEKCSTEFKFEIAKNFESCPVCGVSFDEQVENVGAEDRSDWITWYYYKDPEYGDYSLWDKLPNDPNALTLIQELKAPPESECGLDKVKEILRTYVPDAFVYPEKKEPVIRCPRCFSTDFQLVPKKFSLLTGFATNHVDRVCVKCMKRF